MNINVHKKPSNKITKNGVNLTTKHEMKEENLKYWPNDYEVSYQMYYKPEILTDYYKDAPKEKFASSVNLNPGGQLLNIAYKVENLLNALSTFEKADMPYETMGGRKIIHHKNKNKKAMSKIIHQIHDDVIKLDKELFYPNSKETREISIESTSKSSFKPTINESYYQNRNPRQISVSGVQKRGGQSCVDRYIPIWANPFTYHESAHCLRFSDLWYSVYRLKDPFIYHSVYFEVFEKNCKSYEHGWQRCTGGDIVQIGTFHRKSVNDGPTIVFTYTPFSATNNKYFCFDPLLHQIMVPRMVPNNLVEKYPQVDEGPGRYLLVSPSGVSHDGEDCDKAGVGYSAFASQPDRCNKPAGSCLRNQPLDFWQHDNDALAHNQTGSFFLDNFAAVEDSSIKIAEGKQFLTVGYAGHYTSIVEIEMRLDDNIVIRNESPALIHEVLIDSTCEHQTKITIKVTNAGYVSTAYRPKITNCPVNVPNIWYDNEGPLVYIAPFRIHVFRVTLYGTTRPSRFHCSVEIMNNRSETLAVRRIRIQKYDRCFCVWHCLCSCAASSQKFGCHPMSIDHYHAAGFVGSVPETDVLLSKQITMTHYRENIARAVIVIAYLYAILIFFGLIKAIYGSLCYRRLALMHLQTLCPGLFQAAKLMPSLCPCRREILRTNSADSLSSDGSDIVNPQSKRPASVLLLEFFYNTICYVCIVGLYIFIIVAKSLKCCIFLCIPERRRDSRTVYDTRSFESSFSDMLEEHEKRGTLNSDEFLKKCEALKNKHMPYMLRKRNKRSKKDLLNDIREEFLDIYRNAAIYPNIKTMQNVFYGEGARSDIKFPSSDNHSYNKKIKSLNVKKSQLGIGNTLHKINDCLTNNGENQRNKEQLRKKVKKFLIRKSIFSPIALHNIPKKKLAKNEKKDIGSGSPSPDLADLD